MSSKPSVSRTRTLQTKHVLLDLLPVSRKPHTIPICRTLRAVGFGPGGNRAETLNLDPQTLHSYIAASISVVFFASSRFGDGGAAFRLLVGLLAFSAAFESGLRMQARGGLQSGAQRQDIVLDTSTLHCCPELPCGACHDQRPVLVPFLQ